MSDKLEILDFKLCYVIFTVCTVCKINLKPGLYLMNYDSQCRQTYRTSESAFFCKVKLLFYVKTAARKQINICVPQNKENRKV